MSSGAVQTAVLPPWGHVAVSADLPAVTAGQVCGDMVAGIWQVGQECGRLSHDAQSSTPPPPTLTQKIRRPSVPGAPGQAVLAQEISFSSSQGGGTASLPSKVMM